MRRLFLPVIVLAVTIAAIVLTVRANGAANPDDPETTDSQVGATTPVLSVRRAPDWLRRPKADGLLTAAAAEILSGDDVPEATCLVVHRDDEPLVLNGQGLVLEPGKTQRLVNLSALDLVPQTGFTTTVVRRTVDQPADGAIPGDLFLIGGGDPVLSTDDFAAGPGSGLVHTRFEDLANEVATSLLAQGINRVGGRVVGDESRYPVERSYELDGTWTSGDNADNTVGPLSALMINNGFIGPYPDPADPTALQRASNPTLEAASRLQTLLEEAGISFGGSPTAGAAPLTAAEQVEIGSIPSPPLSAIAARALLDGTTAEMLFKEIGRRSGAQPTRAEAAVGVFFTLANEELDLPISIPLAPVDGSGLSRQNGSTCDLLVAVLDMGDGDSLLDEILPVIGQTDLAGCAPETTGAVRVYGAARDTATSLAGKYTAANGDVVTFALIANQVPDAAAEPPPPFEDCNRLQTALLNAVAGHPYGPELDDMSPMAIGEPADG